ncbi:hypothetical protein STCU_11429 [Strigomonas culicis]|uniref:Uncharacterized protein n=1 Tax=Strigomonas culicis TaxID=28005 RepID=S9TE13_9TRYP|nr:hypothetical protein STCU_11429 [Strigomonas culicis]|eukprot:EPY16277.1 hypothetical protein STCU_11429 [Strigomonas culicis]
MTCHTTDCEPGSAPRRARKPPPNGFFYVHVEKGSFGELRAELLTASGLKPELCEDLQRMSDKGVATEAFMVLAPGAALIVVQSSEIQVYHIVAELAPFAPKKSLATVGGYVKPEVALAQKDELKGRRASAPVAKKGGGKAKDMLFEVHYVSNELHVDGGTPQGGPAEDGVAAARRDPQGAPRHHGPRGRRVRRLADEARRGAAAGAEPQRRRAPAARAVRAAARGAGGLPPAGGSVAAAAGRGRSGV